MTDVACAGQFLRDLPRRVWRCGARGPDGLARVCGELEGWVRGPSRPPSPGTGGGVGPVEPTTREPHPVRPGGGGWVGGGGPVIVEHITDWWYEDPNGTITYLGSMVNEKTKEL